MVYYFLFNYIMKESIDVDYEDFSVHNFTSIISYIKNNYIQFLLLILVFFIVFIVDYISNINAIIFSIPSPIPSFPLQKQSQVIPHHKIKLPKKRKSLKR